MTLQEKSREMFGEERRRYVTKNDENKTLNRLTITIL